MQHRSAQTLIETVDAIRAQYGHHAIGKLRQQPTQPTLSTDIPLLDTLIGGLPQNRLTEFVGHSTSGMQTLALTILANAQATGRSVAYIDLGNTLDATFAAGCGVDLATLVRVCPADGAQGFEIADTLLRRRAVELLIFQCEPLLYDGTHILSSVLPQLTRTLARSNAAFVLLSHPYLARTPIADYAALRLQIERKGWLVRYGDTVGYRIGVTVQKSRVVPIGQQTTFDLTFNQGDDHYL